MATTMPVAADRKFCTARPAICTKYPMVDSPEYACQLVFVMKLMAVLNDESGLTAANFCGLSGKKSCRRCNP